MDLKINNEDWLGRSLGLFFLGEEKACFDDLWRPFALHWGIKPLWRKTIHFSRYVFADKTLADLRVLRSCGLAVLRSCGLAVLRSCGYCASGALRCTTYARLRALTPNPLVVMPHLMRHPCWEKWTPHQVRGDEVRAKLAGIDKKERPNQQFHLQGRIHVSQLNQPLPKED